MKKIISMLLVLIAIISLSSCTVLDKVMDTAIGKIMEGGIGGASAPSEVPIEIILGSVTGSEYGNRYKELARYKHPTFALGAADKEKYPALSLALSHLEKELCGETVSEYESLVEVALEAEREGWELYDALWYEYDAVVHRADSVATSIVISNDNYSGGAHGYYFYYGENFDSKTGEKIKLSDVIADYDMFVSEGGRKLKEMGDALFPDVNTQEALGNLDELLWTLEPEGITVYFTPYEIAPFSSGAISITLSEKEFPGLMNEQYLSPLPYTCMELPSWTDNKVDVTGDRVADAVNWGITPMSMETDGEIRISINDNTYTSEIYATEARGFLICTEEGENFFLVAVESFGREGEIITYRLGSGVEKIASSDVILEKIYDGDAWNETRGRTLTNPYSFYAGKMYNRMYNGDIGFAEYKMNADGSISRVGDIYIIPEEARDSYMLLQPLEVEKYDPERSAAGKTVTIEPKETIHHYGDDDDSNAYFTYNDKMYRVRIDTYEDSLEINGTELEFIFDGFYRA